jgi:hexosaminidase
MPMKNLSLLPPPRRLCRKPAGFPLSAATVIHGAGSTLDAARLLAEYIAEATGLSLATVSDHRMRHQVIALSEHGLNDADEAGFRSEKYSLNVDGDRIELAADNPDGLARAIQTFRQLIPDHPAKNGSWTIPGVAITDEPEFRWRGMLLDVARHFFSREEVCCYIDRLALHKFNVFHLHLTDDQGWRIEIKKYPRLTEVGSIRRCTQQNHLNDRPIRFDEVPHRGFFTQEDIRYIVAFAARRRITVLPEIDMPGHVEALLAAYPEFGNLPGFRYTVRESWGVSSHILNVKPATLAAMKLILDEVIDLFPSRFVHIGGDEVKKDEWAASRPVQTRMAELGVKDEHELQSYFIAEMRQHIELRGRRLIGWDEILEGGLPAGTAVMCWRGNAGGIKAAKLAHDVVMADSSMVYLNHYQADPVTEPLSHGYELPIGQVYRFNPVPTELCAEEATHILGGQGALWSEYIADYRHLEYMTFPRACAMAERLWSPRENCDYLDFLNRLRQHRKRLNKLKVNMHPLPL